MNPRVYLVITTRMVDIRCRGGKFNELVEKKKKEKKRSPP